MTQIPNLPTAQVGLPSRARLISSSIKAGMSFNQKRQKERAKQPPDLIKDLGQVFIRLAAVEATEFGLKKIAKRQLSRRLTQKFGGHVFKGVRLSNVLTAAACLLVDQGIDTAQLARGKINKKEFRRRSAENAGGAFGGLGGAATGATIGTFLCPGIGTTLGGIIGGLVGGIGGSHKSGELAEKL